MIQFSAILTDYLGRVLLIPDLDANTLKLPVAQPEPGALPVDTLAEALRLSTGIIALPVRLTGIYAGSTGLTLSYRTVQRGGAIATADDSRPVAAFYDAMPTPKPASAAIRQQIQDAIHHTGGQPICAVAEVGFGKRLRRVLGADQPPVDDSWRVVVNLIARDSAGDVQWQHEPGETLLRLPSAAVPRGSLPCDIARNLAREMAGSAGDLQLNGIYLDAHEPVIEFVYCESLLPGGNMLSTTTPGTDPARYDPNHLRQVQQSSIASDEVTTTIIRDESGPAAGRDSNG